MLIHRFDDRQNTSLVHSDNAGWYSIKSQQTETHVQIMRSANRFLEHVCNMFNMDLLSTRQFPKIEQMFCE